jgi:hypothetical protein
MLSACAEHRGATDAPARPAAGTDVGAAAIVYRAESGGGAVVFVPIGPEGPRPVRVTPLEDRTGDAIPTLVAVAPEGNVGVIQVEGPDDPRALFAVRRDAPPGVAPARTRGFGATNPLVSDDGRQLVYRDGVNMFRLPVEGGPVVPLGPIPSPRWLNRSIWVEPAGRIAYEVGSDDDIALHSVRTDGTDPRELAAQGRVQHVLAVLPDGRLLATLTGGGLYALPAAGGRPVRLTPRDVRADLVGVADGGRRAVVVLNDRTKAAGRQLFTVATDGSNAAAPIALSRAHEPELQAVTNADGSRVAFVVSRPGPTWVVFEGPTAGPAPAAVSAPLPNRPILAGYAEHDRALVGCAGGDWAADVVRFDLPGAATARPVVLFDQSDFAHRCPSPDMSVDPSVAVFRDNLAALYRVVPVAGGSSWTLPVRAGLSCRLARGGAVCLDTARRQVLRRRDADGTVHDLYTEAAGWGFNAELLPDGETVRVWTNTGSVFLPGDGHRPAAALARDALRRETLGYLGGALYQRSVGRPADAPSTVEAVPLDAPNELRRLYSGPIRSAFLDPDARGVFVLAEDLVFLPTDGGAVVTVVRGAGALTALVYDPVGDQILAVRAFTEVIAAARSGADAGAPRVLAGGLGARVVHLLPIPGRPMALMSTSIFDTDTWKPHQMYAIATDKPGAPRPVGPPGAFIESPPPGRGLRGPGIFSPDATWVLLRRTGHDTLLAVSVDGGDGVALGEATRARRTWTSRDGRWVLFETPDGPDAVASLEPPGPGRPLPGRGGRFSTDGLTVAYLGLGDDQGAVFATEPPEFVPRRLTPPGLAAIAIAAVTPTEAIFLVRGDRDRRLFAVPLDGTGSPRPLTSAEDGDVLLVGVLRPVERPDEGAAE